MGYGELFHWRTDKEIVEYWLKPSGLSMEQLSEQYPEGGYFAKIEYATLARGEFPMPSKKIELYSQTLADYSYDPLR